VPSFLRILGRRSLVGWPSGTSIDSLDTLSFSVLSGVRSMNEVFPLERAAEAYDHMMSGKARFRCIPTTDYQIDGERKVKTMEYLTYLVTTVPEVTSPAKVDELSRVSLHCNPAAD
jgi:hypothetical protein